MFNALKYIRTLESVGFKREQAEAQVQLVMDLYEENVATKADLAELRAATQSDLAELRGELKTDIAELRAEIKSDISELFVRFATLVLGGITVATGILGYLIKS